MKAAAAALASEQLKVAGDDQRGGLWKPPEGAHPGFLPGRKLVVINGLPPARRRARG